MYKRQLHGLFAEPGVALALARSLAPRLTAREARGVIDVAVVRLPHLSNFTDFDPLSRVPGVGAVSYTHLDVYKRQHA